MGLHACVLGKTLSEKSISGSNTDFSFSPPLSHLLYVPFPCPVFCLSLIFFFLLCLDCWFVSPSFLALFPPCRTRWWKAASAQSSRSGGEGGSVLLGMNIKASTGEWERASSSTCCLTSSAFPISVRNRGAFVYIQKICNVFFLCYYPVLFFCISTAVPSVKQWKATLVSCYSCLITFLAKWVAEVSFCIMSIRISRVFSESQSS